jgi:hypothetical protein
MTPRLGAETQTAPEWSQKIAFGLSIFPVLDDYRMNHTARKPALLAPTRGREAL